MAETIRITAEIAERLDVAVAAAAGVTRSRAAALIKQGRVLADGEARCKAGFDVKPGMALEICVPDAAPARAVAQDLEIDVVYQDADLAVVLKPSGMVAHPAAGNPDGTLVNALLARLDSLSGVGGELRPGIVHRIDKDTSGLLLVAKNDRAHLALSEQIAAHTVERAYLAILEGRMKTADGFVDAPIGRHPSDRKRMAIVPGGREARTNWRLLEELKGASLVECVLTTGRTHQIRVHMASKGHPVLGDPVYAHRGMSDKVMGGQLLHAYKIGFTHPATGERMLFTAPPEDRFVSWYKKLGGADAEGLMRLRLLENENIN